MPNDRGGRDSRLIGIVGPCSSGKSELGGALRALGYRVKEIMQEHCAAPAMWQLLTNPDVLVYLDVDMNIAARREGLSSPSSWWEDERTVRLAHARAHCDVYVDTSQLTSDEVVAEVVRFLASETVG